MASTGRSTLLNESATITGLRLISDRDFNGAKIRSAIRRSH
jgi:hypothetical protein